MPPNRCYASHIGPAFSLGHSPSSARTRGFWPAAIHSTTVYSAILISLQPVIHVNMWITNHLPTSKGWKAELAHALHTYLDDRLYVFIGNRLNSLISILLCRQCAFCSNILCVRYCGCFSIFIFSQFVCIFHCAFVCCIDVMCA